MVRLKSYAKINLSLDIIRKLDSGYHEINTVLHQTGLYDIITLRNIDKGIKIACNNKDIPSDSSNLAYKSANLLKKKFNINTGIEINIEKKIPVGAGLGGGSSNAAAVLKGLNALWNLNLDDAQLQKLGSEIGMDVPFFIIGGTAFGSGKGEILRKINHNLNFNILLVFPDIKIDTKKAYQNVVLNQNKKSSIKAEKALLDNDFGELIKNMHNDFELTVFSKYPKIAELKNFFKKNKNNALMSGSGSSVFCLSQHKEELKIIYNAIKNSYKKIFLL